MLIKTEYLNLLHGYNFFFELDELLMISRRLYMLIMQLQAPQLLLDLSNSIPSHSPHVPQCFSLAVCFFSFSDLSIDLECACYISWIGTIRACFLIQMNCELHLSVQNFNKKSNFLIVQ